MCIKTLVVTLIRSATAKVVQMKSQMDIFWKINIYVKNLGLWYGYTALFSTIYSQEFREKALSRLHKALVP